MTDSPAQPETCRVCGGTIPPDRVAHCNNCHEPFHLRTRQGQDGADCGDVWINEQYLSLEFVCFDCLGKSSREPAVGEGH
ncbi:MAG TPA: hypothetical protein VIW01_14130 [Dehalococcoidia bacterium]